MISEIFPVKQVGCTALFPGKFMLIAQQSRVMVRYATKKAICGAIYKCGVFLLSKRLKKWYNPCMRELDTLKT